MAFEILNEAASVVYVLAGENRYPQAEPDKVDFDILAQGINEEGVVSGCAVTPQGAPDTTVAVAAGVVRIAGTDVAYAGGNVNCGAAHAAFPRFDLIAISNAGAASAVAGVAAEPPVFPAVPANSVIIAAVWRAANDNTITAADIVDKRCMLLGATFGTVPTLLAIDGAGIADPDRFHHTLAANAGVADDLNGMTATSIIANGEPVIIRPDAGDAITIKHNALGGADARNILCIGNADIVCDDDHDFAICIYSTAIGAGSWMVLGGGAAAGGGYDTIQEEGAPVVQRTTANFIGPGVLAVDNAPNTRTDITVWTPPYDGIVNSDDTLVDIAGTGIYSTIALALAANKKSILFVKQALGGGGVTVILPDTLIQGVGFQNPIDHNITIAATRVTLFNLAILNARVICQRDQANILACGFVTVGFGIPVPGVDIIPLVGNPAKTCEVNSCVFDGSGGTPAAGTYITINPTNNTCEGARIINNKFLHSANLTNCISTTALAAASVNHRSWNITNNSFDMSSLACTGPIICIGSTQVTNVSNNAFLKPDNIGIELNRVRFTAVSANVFDSLASFTGTGVVLASDQILGSTGNMLSANIFINLEIGIEITYRSSGGFVILVASCLAYACTDFIRNSAAGPVGNLVVGTCLLYQVTNFLNQATRDFRNSAIVACSGVFTNLVIGLPLHSTFFVRASYAPGSTLLNERGPFLPALDNSWGIGDNTTRWSHFYGYELYLKWAALALVAGVNSAVNVAGYSLARITGPVGAFSISGFVAANDGKLLEVYNDSGQNMTLNHEDAVNEAVAANRIKTMTGANVTLVGDSAATLYYNVTESRWILVNSES